MIGTCSRIIRAARRFRRDQRGVSAVEFAFIAPILITFYFGLAEYTQAIMAQRRTISAASAIGDLISQAPGTTTKESIQDAMNIANIVIYPFPTGGNVVGICVDSITASTATTPVDTVAWQVAQNDTTCPGLNTTVSGLSTNLIGSGQSVIMANVTYKYTSPVNVVMHTNPTFSRTYYLRPRRATSITCTDC